MNYTSALLIGVSLLIFSGCGEDIDASNGNNNKQISKVETHNTDSIQVDKKNLHEPQADKGIMQTFTDALQTALDKRDIDNPNIETNVDPYDYPDNDPYNDSNI